MKTLICLKQSFFFLFTVLILSSCGGGGGGDFNGQATVTGRAVVPVAGTSNSSNVPFPNGTVSVVSASAVSLKESIDPNVTDLDGNYTTTIPEGGGAIIVRGNFGDVPVRVSGLVRQQAENEEKELNPITDLAYEAYAGAVDDGVLNSGNLTSDRIAQLEAAASEYLSQNDVDFFTPESVANAASRVRQVAGISAATTPVEESTEETTSNESTEETGLGCSQGESACADGFPICAELLCNGTLDCADGSDEDPASCGPQVEVSN